MGFLKEFKQFAIKGNVVDLAIAVVIGGAFGKIVTSLVEDIITPAILTPALEKANLKNLNELVIPGTAIKYGNFLSQVISFIIIAFALFVIVRMINSMKKKEEATPAAPSSTDKLLIEIRDELKNKP
ncbi:large conductance mechanosensitive channel protein MscL [Niabella ginsengisoli]|uniref:Large-conductance mechanosensitive channel n=1 Tax=Niabella ginsengisoli TaxID=522298 RepID=A0ABS9SER8_9BACT|nr:large conductance mechanosensitive channel protein MscL [Niabella ginsengisoli]MCH5596859.1 large conductance mechanosensitive channel protein MscL [Niabella ginsengisoli]